MQIKCQYCTFEYFCHKDFHLPGECEFSVFSFLRFANQQSKHLRQRVEGRLGAKSIGIPNVNWVNSSGVSRTFAKHLARHTDEGHQKDNDGLSNEGLLVCKIWVITMMGSVLRQPSNQINSYIKLHNLLPLLIIFNFCTLYSLSFSAINSFWKVWAW